MAGYKNHIGSKFGSCRLVAHAHDPHRNRPVKLYHIPGDFECVGIDDGTDCFVSPISIDPFASGIARIFADIRAGKEIEVKELDMSPTRKRFTGQLVLPMDPPVERKRFVPSASEQVVRRVLKR